jgi:PDZ domain-containing protein/peptidase M48-like protein
MPRADPRRLFLAGLCALTSACATMPRQVDYPAGGSSAAPSAAAGATALGGGWDNSLEGLRADDQRVADIAYRIATANAELCAERAPLTGLVLQSAQQFSPEVRAKAAAAFHIDARPSVEAVAAGSPAAAAGLRIGDTVLAVNGQPLPGAAGDGDAGAASYAPVERANRAISQALAGGDAHLAVLRDGQTLTIALNSQPGCAYDAEVIPDSRLRASADGRHVFVTSALVSFARSDEALALILAHEYAHDLLRHHDRLDRAGFARDILGDFGSSPASLFTAEKEADYVGLYLMARAGYDISSAPDIMSAFPDAAGDFDWSHPGVKARAAALAATRDEIMRKRAAGAPLLPTSARSKSSTDF